MIKNPELESVFAGHITHKNFWEQQKDGSWKRVKRYFWKGWQAF